MVDSEVIVYQAEKAAYPPSAPFDPQENYPEYAFAKPSHAAPNGVYAAVRDVLRLAGLDSERFGTPDWNPLGKFIKPGQFVLLKPNLIKETHPRDPEGWRYTITNGSMIRAVADYVWKALEGRGRVMIADSPQTDSSFDAMVGLLGLDDVRAFYRANGLELEVVDIRKEQWKTVDEVVVERKPLQGDPGGYVALDLGDRSEFVDHPGAGRYYGADYDEGEVNRHHANGRHEYLLSGSAVACDVFINLPKLKTHKKAGITVSLKNLVGINGDKNWLPHHTVGTPDVGGDQFPAATLKRSIEHKSAALLRRLALRFPVVGPWVLQQSRRTGKRAFGDTEQVIRSGNWHGNDTTWRMCLDLNKAMLYGKADGLFRSPELSSRKTYLSFVDGIIAGEGNGPINPDPVECGLLLFGCDPSCTDAVAAVLMGFDPDRIPIVARSFSSRGFPLTGAEEWGRVKCTSNVERWNGELSSIYAAGDVLHFRAHFGWIGHCEVATA